MMGFSAQRYHRYEDNRVPGAFTIKALAKVLDVDARWLLGGAAPGAPKDLDLDEPVSYPEHKPDPMILRDGRTVACDTERLHKIEADVHLIKVMLARFLEDGGHQGGEGGADVGMKAG